jgi:molybdopterin molybdotransferase
MPEFLQLLAPLEALDRFIPPIHIIQDMEEIATPDGLGRVIAKPYSAPHPLPSFIRSSVDGYAVRATDTYGASDAQPDYFQLIGEVKMGEATPITLLSGQCSLIHTGGMLPAGADSVVMLEYTQATQLNEIEVLRAVAKGENVLHIGEDVRTGEVVIPGRVRVRPVEIGGLMSLGITKIQVVRKPRVAVISSGDEIISPERELGPGKVRDINAYLLSALVTEAGGLPINYGIIPDQEAVLFEVADRSWNECDLVIITAGSSASVRDLTAGVIKKLGQPGVLVHGVNIKPGKPTILGICNTKPVIGLPGNPVSAYVSASLFVVPAIEHLLGLTNPRIQPVVYARLTTNIPSQAGREDWVAVRLQTVAGVLTAEPIFGKSNLIFTLVRSDGLVRIASDVNGLESGSTIQVFLL